MARLDAAQLPDMGSDGEEVRQRRERLGLTQAELGEAADPAHPIHRNTISAIEEGRSGNRAKLAAVKRALDELEAEAGFDAPPGPETPAQPRTVVVSLGEGRGRVVLEGSIEDLVQLTAEAERLFRVTERLRQQESEVRGNGS